MIAVDTLPVRGNIKVDDIEMPRQATPSL